MKEDEKEIDRDSLLQSRFVFGIIVNTSLRNIEKIKEFILDNTNSRIIYQKISAGKLWIKEGEIG